LERVNWLLGPLLYFMYQVFVSFVLLSLLIAIIEDAFQSTQKELEENHEKDELVSAMKATGRNIWTTVINGVKGSTQVISSRLRSASASGGSMRVNSRSMSSNFQGWFKKKSKLNPSEEGAGENNNGGGNGGTKDNGSNELQNTGKKEKKRRMTHTFLQAVIQAGKIEKEKEKKRAAERDRDRAAAETKHQSNNVAGYGATGGGGGDSSGDRGDRGQIAAHNNKIIAMTREVTRETTRTNSKISALEEKMDMILASFDAMIKTQAQSMNKASVVSSLQPDANVDASQSLHLPTKKDHKKSRRKSRRSSSALPPGWKKYRDDASGKNYYYNEYTEDRSWEKPSSMGTPKE
jgi:hypothetical protein